MFQPYRPQRAFEYITEEIKKLILQRRLDDGDRLPSERELAEQFHVGRITIRETMRTLETLGLIQIRKGSMGGAFVSGPSSNAMPCMIMDRLQLDGTTHEQVIEARDGLETAIIRSVIEHATPEDLELIAREVDESKKVRDPSEAGLVVAGMLRFHILLAESSHNLPYVMFLRSIMEWAARRMTRLIPTPEIQTYSYRSHKKILEAVLKKDAVLAERLVREHIKKMGVMVGKSGKRYRSERRGPAAVQRLTEN